MAIDEALLRSTEEQGIPTLRFYRWEVPTLSLGYFQHHQAREDHEASLGCPLVRRASGGGAILHHHELTYCYLTPVATRFGNAQHHYDLFHDALVELLRGLGMPAHKHAEDAQNEAAFLCFQRRAKGDVILGSHKICGSAQRRWKNTLLQHGSLLVEKSTRAPELPGLRDLNPSIEITYESLTTQWCALLTKYLETEFFSQTLTDKEEALTAELVRDKFANEQFTGRR